MVTNENFEYRFATPKDKERLYEFALFAIEDPKLPSVAKDVGEDLMERVSLEKKKKEVLIAIDKGSDDRVIGYIEVDKNRYIPGKACYIRGIYVLPSYRRKGVGRNLVKELMKEKCVRKEQLRVEALTEKELAFWKELGFKIHHYSLYYDECE